MPFIVLDSAAAQAAPVVSFGAVETAAQHPAGKSLLALRTILKLELGQRPDIPDPIWNEWINDGYQDFYSTLRLPESKASFPLATVTSQPMYLMPPVVNYIRSISGADPMFTTQGGELTNIDEDSYRKLPVRTGTPEYWFREKNILVLWPTPDQVFNLAVDITVKPAPLVADTDYPALEDKWHESLKMAAKYRAWTGVQNDTKSALTQNEMTRQIQRRGDAEADDKNTEYAGLRPVFRRTDITRLRRRGRFEDNW
jgi:hypothetical protein